MLWALGGLGTRACAVQCTTTHRAARRGPTHDVLFFLVALVTIPRDGGILICWLLVKMAGGWWLVLYGWWLVAGGFWYKWPVAGG